METNVPKHEDPGTERSLGRRIAVLSRHIRWIVDHKLGALGLTSGTHYALVIISVNPGVSQNEVGEAREVDKATAAKEIARLETLGLVRRVPDERDHRFRRLFLTEKGERLVPRIYDALREVTAISAAALTDAETDTLFELLERVDSTVSRYIEAERMERPDS